MWTRKRTGARRREGRRREEEGKEEVGMIVMGLWTSILGDQGGERNKEII
jgi:hypothetical protein